MTQETIVRLKIISVTRTPEMITAATGLECDDSWHQGDTRKHTIIIEKNNGWVFNSDLPKSAALEEHLERIWHKLKPAAAQIRHISTKDIIELSCVIYSSTRPVLNFDSLVIGWLAELGASLDIDLYIG